MQRPKVAVFGAGGMLGARLTHYLQAKGNLDIVPLRRADADITDKNTIAGLLRQMRPDWAINCAAFLNVDRCEQEPEPSHQVNYLAAVSLGEIVAEMKGARLIQFSTDYVFDGRNGGYDETSPANPLSVYGKHKYMADEVLTGTPTYILRTASLVGAGEDGRSDMTKNFLGRVADGARKLEAVEDMEISVATPKFLAEVVTKIIEHRPETGIYNAVAEGKTGWLDIARQVFSTLRVEVELAGVPASAFPRPAPRPMKSWLKTDKLRAAVGPLPSWQEAVTAQIEDLRGMYQKILGNKKAA